MARIYHRKARKDYPDQGIKKGDMYYTANIKTGPRSSRVLRSKKPLRASQMTVSPFKSAYFAMQEDWDDAKSKGADDLRTASEALRAISEEAGESFDNMPENLQDSETGQLLENRREECESKADELDNLADEYDSLDDVEEPSDEADEEAQTEYEDALSHREDEIERIISEASDLIEDMPE